MSQPAESTIHTEFAYLRKTQLAVEVLDAVTLARISTGLTVTAEGLQRHVTMSHGGLFVWLEDPGHVATRVSIDPGELPFEPNAVDLPPAPVLPVRIELAPLRNYPFTPGIAGLRARLVRSAADDPLQGLTAATLRLQWIDDAAAGTVWNDAPTEAHTDDAGDFAAILRLTATQVARLDAQGNLRVRLSGTYGGQNLFSAETAIAPGRIADHDAFAWDTFQP